MEEKLNPDALAECGDEELDSRPGVQGPSEEVIREYILSENELPPESAYPFAEYVYKMWYAYNEDGDATVKEIIDGALQYWRGQ